MQGFCRNCFPTFQWKQLLKTIGFCFLKRNVLRFLWLLSCKQSTPHFPTYGQSNLNDQLKDTVKVNEVLVWKYTYGTPRWQTGVQSSFDAWKPTFCYWKYFQIMEAGEQKPLKYSIHACSSYSGAHLCCYLLCIKLLLFSFLHSWEYHGRPAIRSKIKVPSLTLPCLYISYSCTLSIRI